jgi:hypothetical protein
MDDIYYVYKHLDNGNIVYIGMGSFDRAWSLKRKDKEHIEWLKSKLPLIDIVFVATGLPRDEALAIEKDLIKEFKPKFNILHTERDSARAEHGRWLFKNHPKCMSPEAQRERGLKAAASKNSMNKQVWTCIHCGAVGNPGNISRYHNNNCKERVDTNDIY